MISLNKRSGYGDFKFPRGFRGIIKRLFNPSLPQVVSGKVFTMKQALGKAAGAGTQWEPAGSLRRARGGHSFAVIYFLYFHIFLSLHGAIFLKP